MPENLFIRDDDEGLFSRDINGQLVRLDAPAESDYHKTAAMEIDGQAVTVPLAEPLKDANGNFVLDLHGRTTPRFTTIYDAAVHLFVKEPGDEAKIPIPTLCHSQHMTPVAVCRLCVVQIYGKKRGQRAAERKLLPACQHQVKDGMEVFTMQAPGTDGDRVRQAVKVLTELLAADHLKPTATPELAEELSPFNELGRMTEQCGASPSRFALDVLSPAMQPAGHRRFDASSPVFVVDHTACILCDRCVRACDEVMENNVIGRTGKGAHTGIGFDLDDPMGDSSCVQCGECMVSCPTSAITFKPVAKVKPRAQVGAAESLPAVELLRDPIFAGIPPKFLLWQQGLVIRRRLLPGQALCRQGDAGNTAFLLKRGKFEATVLAATPPAKGLRLPEFLRREQRQPVLRIALTPADLIVGEMACMTGSPRSATVTALEESEVWEIRRNVLDRLMRLPSQRQRFENEYRERALDLTLQGVDLFKHLGDEDFRQIVDRLRQRLAFVRVSPGQILFRQGDRVDDLYLIRLGNVRVSIARFGNEAQVLSSGPGAILGDVGLLGLSPQDARKPVDEIDDAFAAALANAGDDLAAGIPAGFRAATCSAVGFVELARISRADFLHLVRQFPLLRRRLVEQSLALLRGNEEPNPFLNDYFAQGLYEGQSLLVLDMDLCTRCDECTRGCVEQHGVESHGVPIARMLRDGLRFDRFLIATSCRSCTEAHCMVGCPVDAIHRGKHLQIVIEDHCIGCGLCATNCPYGNISMMPNTRKRIEAPDPEHPGETLRIAQLKAVTCDLCDAHGRRSTPEPRCVAACPHEAAFRMTGPQLLQRVMKEA